MRLTAARGPRHHEVDEDRVEDPDVDLGVDDPQVDRVRQPRPLGRDQPQPGRDQDRHDQLRAAAQAQRAPLRDLHVVVGEAEQRARDRDAEDADRARVEVRQQQERHRDRGEDDDPAHRGRARLGVVLLRALLADLLAELPPPQERDELGREEDADQQRGRAGDEDLAHQPSASAQRLGDDLEADPARALHEQHVAGRDQVGGQRGGLLRGADRVALAVEGVEHDRARAGRRSRARRRPAVAA